MMGLGESNLLVASLFSMHLFLGSVHSTNEHSVIVDACDANAWEVGGGGSGVQSHPQLLQQVQGHTRLHETIS